MQRKELRKAIKEYSNKTNFYKLSLVRRFLQSEEKEIKRLKNAVPTVKCPHCGSSKVSVEHSESEYSSDHWLCCDNCYETFDDDFGLRAGGSIRVTKGKVVINIATTLPIAANITDKTHVKRLVNKLYESCSTFTLIFLPNNFTHEMG